MKQWKGLTMREETLENLQEEIRSFINLDKKAAMNCYGAPKYLTEEELVDFCVGVEYQNAFK